MPFYVLRCSLPSLQLILDVLQYLRLLHRTRKSDMGSVSNLSPSGVSAEDWARQNHRRVQVEGHLWRSPSPAFCSQQGQLGQKLDEGAQSLVQVEI